MLADTSLCTGCSACAAACPKKCIYMKPNEQGFLYPQVDSSLCVNCGICQKTCPVLTSHTPSPLLHSAYGVRSKDQTIRQASSSGGVFPLIAEKVIHQGGIVFGACFTQDWEVIHSYTNDSSVLTRLYGSKYVQSTLGDAYRYAKTFLDANHPVLFSGTPCQIAGLRQFLGKSYVQLLCVDTVCHGVPTPLAWQKYLSERKFRANSEVRAISFRDKTFGWKDYSLRIEFQNGRAQLSSPSLDPYMRAFLANYTLRESCFNCSFKENNHFSDLTIADFWGIESILPDFDDGHGVSLVMVHTQKGAEILSNIQEDADIQEVDATQVFRANSSAVVSASKPNNYASFWSDFYHSNSFCKTVERYCPLPFSLRCKLQIVRLLKSSSMPFLG